MVADIDPKVTVPGKGLLEHIPVLEYAGVPAEKGLAHIIIDPDDIKAFFTKKTCCLGTDKPARTGNDHD
jgi:hypothetical protein